MIVSPDAIPSTNMQIDGQGILTIQKEILLIDTHRREHLANDDGRSKPDLACAYCKRHYFAEKSQTSVSMGRKENVSNRREQREIERMVNITGKSGAVVVPKTWVGKRVRITLMDRDRYDGS